MLDSGFRSWLFRSPALQLCLPFVPSLPVLLAFLCKLLASRLVATLLRFCTSFASVCALFCLALRRLLVYLLISLLLLLLALQLTCLYFLYLACLLLLHFLQCMSTYLFGNNACFLNAECFSYTFAMPLRTPMPCIYAFWSDKCFSFHYYVHEHLHMPCACLLLCCVIDCMPCLSVSFPFAYAMPRTVETCLLSLLPNLKATIKLNNNF